MYINKETLRLDYEVEAEEAGLKIIDVMATSMDLSSRLIRKCKNHKHIFLNQKDGSVNRIVQKGDIISVLLDHDENTFDPNPIDIKIIYEDGYSDNLAERILSESSVTIQKYQRS